VADNSNILGEYLRARREQIRPEDVGLIGGARRRVPGLRREELALLAGISVEYYLRLEQGRDKHPSPEVIAALANALQLDLKATEYLHQVAAPRAVRAERRGVVAPADGHEVEVVTDGADELINQFPMPAIIASRCLNVLAANPLARALSCGLEPGENFLRWRLLAPEAREQFVDWESTTDVVISGLREAAGSDPNDPQVQALVAELSARSQYFRDRWAKADVGYRPGVIHMRHPVVGDLHLYRNRFNIPHSGGQHLLTYRAQPGSPSAAALEELRRS
jgi:transcriptional regulator with XRE-family HTH domain